MSSRSEARVGTSAAPAASSVDERALVEGIRRGEESAFDALFRRYFTPLRMLASSYLRSDDLGAELVQDLFCWIWEQRATWEVRGNVRHYLYSAVRRQSLNALRHEAVVDRWRASASVDLLRLSGLGEGPAAADAGVGDEEIVRALRRAVDALPARRREAFVLRWQHQLSHPEIAQVMGVTVKAVERHLTLALQSLRTTLGPLA